MLPAVVHTKDDMQSSERSQRLLSDEILAGIYSHYS